MQNEKVFYEKYEEFQADHPEYAPEWQEFVEPVVLAEDDSVYNFIFGYLLI